MTPEAAANGISFNPADASVGGTLNDVAATIVSSAIVTYDFNGKTDDGEARTCWAIGYKQDDAENDDDVSVDYIALGKLDQFTPSPDGKRAVPVGSKTQLHKNSKPMIYSRSLIENGFQADKLGSDVSVIVGLHVHLSTVAMPSFKGKDGKETQGKVTLVTKIYEKAAAGKAGGKPAAGKTATKAATTTAPASATSPAGPVDVTSVDPEGKAAEFVFTTIAEAGGKIAKSLLPGKAFKNPDANLRNLVVKAVQNVGWLGAESQPWKFDAATGTLSVE